MTSVEKILQVKRKHHYVWGEYLKPWSKNNQIAYLTSKGKIASDSIKGLVWEKDFYKINKLKNNDLPILEKWLNILDPKRYYQKFIMDILKIQYIQSEIHDQGKITEETKNLFAATNQNLMENIYASTEKRFRQIRDSLLKEELITLQDPEKMIFFMIFIGTQLFRTRKIRDTVIKNLPLKTDAGITCANNVLKESWWLISYLFGANLGKNLYLDRNDDVHSLLINNTRTSFITSDQPVINVNECVSNLNTSSPIEHLNLYFPISPKIAYMISSSKKRTLEKVEITENYANQLNIKMAEKSYIHIFADNKELLKKYLNFTKK